MRPLPADRLCDASLILPQQEALHFDLRLIDDPEGIHYLAFGIHMDGPARHITHRLPNDSNALTHFLHTHEVTIVIISLVPQRDIEFQAVIDKIREGPPNIVVQP